MDLRQLRHFVATVEAGGQAKAAQTAGVTQQALSKSVARLEAEMGARLVERTPKGIVVTRVGARLLESARTILAEDGRLRRDIEALMGRGPASLVVGLSPSASAGEAGRRVAEFQAVNTNLRFEVAEGLELSFTQALLAGRIDLAVASSIEPADPLILAQGIGEETWVVAGRSGHPVLETAERLKDLTGARWLTGPRSAPLEAAILARFEAEGLATPAIDTVTTSILYALSTISRQDLLCVLPLSIVRRWPGLIYRDLGGDAWRTDLVLMRRRRAMTSEAEAALIAFLSEGVRTR